MLGDVRIDKNNAASQLFAQGSKGYAGGHCNHCPQRSARYDACQHAGATAFQAGMIGAFRLPRVRTRNQVSVAGRFVVMGYRMLMPLMRRQVTIRRGSICVALLLQWGARRPSRSERKTEHQQTGEHVSHEGHDREHNEIFAPPLTFLGFQRNGRGLCSVSDRLLPHSIDLGRPSKTRSPIGE